MQESAEFFQDGARPSLKGQAWIHLLYSVGELEQRVDAELRRRADVDIQTYDVLLHLLEASEALRMTDLASAVLLSKSGLTSLVDRLEELDLIERQPDPSDRRAIRVALTPTGVEAYRTASRHHRDVVHDIFFAHVTNEEADIIVAALSRVRAALQEPPKGID